MDINLQAFLALVRSGLWEQDIQLLPYGEIKYKEVYRLAEEQSVVGLVAAGLEHVKDVKIPQDVALQFVGNALQLEQRNTAMNAFIASLIDNLREDDVNAVLVKGQGVAQCYERPLWRASGDVDLLLSVDNYHKALQILTPIASHVEEEREITRHIGMYIESWEVELHGTLKSNLWQRIDNTLEDVQKAVFFNGRVRTWVNGNCQVFLPGPNEDVIFVFSHILQHYFREGIGLRQICDWCRLLWFYKDSLDYSLLEIRLKKMDVLSEWRAFAALLINYLGMPIEAMPLYSDNSKWNHKAEKIIRYIQETGNFGHNKDRSYTSMNNIIARKFITFWRQIKKSMRLMNSFPYDSIRSLYNFTIMSTIATFCKNKK